MNKTATTLATLVAGAAPEVAAADSGDGRATIVLVHGAFFDGSGWAGVHRILRDDGCDVIVVQLPTTPATTVIL